MESSKILKIIQHRNTAVTAVIFALTRVCVCACVEAKGLQVDRSINVTCVNRVYRHTRLLKQLINYERMKQQLQYILRARSESRFYSFIELTEINTAKITFDYNRNNIDLYPHLTFENIKIKQHNFATEIIFICYPSSGQPPLTNFILFKSIILIPENVLGAFPRSNVVVANHL